MTLVGDDLLQTKPQDKQDNIKSHKRKKAKIKTHKCKQVKIKICTLSFCALPSV